MRRDTLKRYLRHGRIEDFTRLLNERQDELLATAHAYLDDPDLARDAVHDVFHNVFSRNWDPEKITDGRGFLKNATILKARAIRRGESRRHEREHRFAAERDASESLPVTLMWDVRDAVAALPATLRKIVELRYYAGLGVKEVASLIGVSKRTVESRLKDARDLLRAKLSPQASALILPVLAGTHAAVWTSPSTLEAAEVGSTSSASVAASVPTIAPATRTAGVLAKSAVAAAALVAIVATLLLSGFDFNDDTGDLARANPAAVPGNDEGIEFAAAAEPAEAVVAVAGPAEDSETPAVAQAKPVVEEEPEPPDLRIEVIGPDGNPVREGTLRFQTPLGAYEKLAAAYVANPEEIEPFRDMDLKPWDLAGDNPFEIDDIPAGLRGIRFTVRAMAPGLSAEEAKFTFKEDEPVDLVIELRDTRELGVEVRDKKTGKPIQGAWVESATESLRRLLDAPKRGEAGPGAGLSDASGRAWISGLSSRLQTIQVSAKGYQNPGRQEIDLDVKDFLEFELEKEPKGSIEVFVLDHAGLPLEGIEVKTEYTGGNRKGTTDVDGRALLDDLPPSDRVSVQLGFGELTIRYQERGNDAAEEYEATGTRYFFGRVLKLRPGEKKRVHLGWVRGSVNFTGRVFDLAGHPLEGVRVKAQAPMSIEATSDAAGLVFFENLPVGKYVFEIGPWQMPAVYLEEGQGDIEREWTIGNTTVSGKVVRAEDEAPVTGAFLTLYRVDGVEEKTDFPTHEDYVAYDESRIQAEAQPDESGRFEFTDVSPGSYELSGYAPSLDFKSLEIEVRPGEEEIEVEFRGQRPPGILVVIEKPEDVRSEDVSVRYWRPETENRKGRCRRFREVPADDENPARWTWESRPLSPGRWGVEVEVPGELPRRREIDVGEAELVRVEF